MASDKENVTTFTTEEIAQLGSLARINITEQEGQSLTSDLNAIVHYVAQLQEVQTENIEPLGNVHGAKNVFRKDTASYYANADAILEQTPARSGRFIQVPLVVDHDEN